MKSKFIYLFIIFFLLTSACATTTYKPEPVSSLSPELWAKNIAASYIMENLKGNSFMAGKSFIITKIDKKGNILFEIDEQTERIREAIKRELLKEHGIRLVSRAPARDIKGKYHFNLGNCVVNYTFPEVVIGLIQQQEGNTVSYSLNARSLETNTFIGGFSRTASFRMTSRMREDVRSVHSDVEIKGVLRDVPFDVLDADQVAESFAYHTACSSRNFGLSEKDGKPVRFFVPRSGTSSITGKVGLLIKHYLSLSSEISLTEDEKKADVTVIMELVPISGNLYQIWLKPVKKDGGIVGGLGFYSYIRLESRLTMNCLVRPFLPAYSKVHLSKDYDCLDVAGDVGRMSEIRFEAEGEKSIYIRDKAEKPLYVFYKKNTSPPVVWLKGKMVGVHLIPN